MTVVESESGSEKKGGWGDIAQVGLAIKQAA